MKNIIYVPLTKTNKEIQFKLINKLISKGWNSQGTIILYDKLKLKISVMVMIKDIK